LVRKPDIKGVKWFRNRNRRQQCLRNWRVQDIKAQSKCEWAVKTRQQAQVSGTAKTNIHIRKGDVWWGKSFNTQIVPKWSGDNFVVRLTHFRTIESTIESLCEDLIKEGMGFIKTLYLPNNIVLLMGLDGIQITNLISSNKATLEEMFDSIVPWTYNGFLFSFFHNNV